MADRTAPPTLAIVNSSARYSGITLASQPYVAALRSMGFRVRWYQCVDRGADPYVPEDGVAVAGVGLPLSSLEMGINRLWVFPRYFRKTREDALLLTDPTLSFVASHARKTVVLVHDLLPLTQYADRVDSYWMFRAILPRLRRMSLVIVTTAMMRSELVHRGVDPRRIRVVPYTHDLGFHPDHPARSAERIARDREVRVLYVATDRPFKNIEFVLRIAAALQREPGDPRFTLTLVSRLRRQTRQRIAELGLRNLHVVESVPSMTALYEESDVLIHPSLHEGFGRPLIEAFAFGIPVLANRIEPLVEILGGAGILLDVDSVGPWVRALRSLVQDGALAGYAARSLARGSEFLPDRFQRTLVEAFREF